ncbi:MAG: tetratricopeptide repeat protein [Promethearchaeota archaeon]
MIRDEFNRFLENGKKYFKDGDYQEAIINFEHALERSYMMGSDELSLIVNEYLGKAYVKMKNPEKAVKHYEDNLIVYEDMQDLKGLATTLNKLGLIYQARGDFQKAIQYHMKCIEACKNLGDKSGEATALKNLGIIHSRLGNHVLALKAHRASLEIKKVLGDRRGEALSLLYLGQSQIDAGDFENARKNLERALEIFTKMGLKDDIKRVESELEDLDALEEEFELELEINHKFHGITGDDFLFR